MCCSRTITRDDQSAPLNVLAYKKLVLPMVFTYFLLFRMGIHPMLPPAVQICLQLLASFGEQGATALARYELHVEHGLRYASQDPQGPAQVMIRP